MDNMLMNKLSRILPQECILKDEPMKKHTSFKIGGPADFMVLPSTWEQLAALLKLFKAEGIPYFILGNGSNLLVSDTGYRGVVIRMFRSFDKIEIEDEMITAGAGASLSAIAAAARGASLTGFEFAGGIPGTLGGAVVMNAGAYGGEMKDVLVTVRVLTKDGEMLVLDAADLEMGYRTSLVKTREYLVLEAKIRLKKGDPEEIKAITKDLTEKRTSKQPLEFPSAGSTFKRPAGYFAGKLIQDSGLRGYTVGGAMVSEKHCGFVINKGNATAADVMQVIRDVAKCVYEKYQVELEAEVKFLGDFE